ncbi:MAG TPA: carbohydrate-binding family 9-like protein [Thermoanaerobaculia bacterium]|nr:carbohydrate-binding family 9-like protein [Thermoanaerobaculia bacterium]
MTAPPVPELAVPSISPTRRLVELPPQRLADAVTGRPPRLSTSLRIALRGRTLCVRFDGRDDGSVATYRGHDENLWEEDVYEVFLAPVDPPHLYFEFEVNPLGTTFDARVDSPDLVRAGMRVDTSWDCSGLSATVRRHPKRWSAALGIPLDELVSPVPARWRANFYRVDRGAPSGSPDEFSAWSPILTSPADFHEARRFGVLTLEP